MADVSGMPSDEEEVDGGDGEEDEGGEEEAGDDEGPDTPKVEDVSEDTRGEDIEDAEDSEMSEAIQPSSVEEPDEPRPVVEEPEEVTIHKARFQPPTLVNLGPPQLGSSRIEGSPLKNVMILSPTEPSPVIPPGATASTSFAASSYLDVKPHTVAMEVDSGSAIHEAHAETKTQGVLPSLRDNNSAASSPRANIKQEVATPPVDLFAPPLKEEAAETPTSVPDQPLPPPARPESVDPPTIETLEPKLEPSPAPQITEPEPEPEPMETDIPDASIQPPDSPALLPTVTEDEDDGLNLLGSLERELDRQGGSSNPRSGEATPNVAAAAATETKQEKGTPAPADAPKDEELVDTASPSAPTPPAATAAAADATAVEDAPKEEPVETASSAAAGIPDSAVSDDTSAAAAAAADGADLAGAADTLKQEPGVEDEDVKAEAPQDEMEIDEVVPAVVPAAEPAAEPAAAALPESG